MMRTHQVASIPRPFMHAQPLLGPRWQPTMSAEGEQQEGQPRDLGGVVKHLDGLCKGLEGQMGGPCESPPFLACQTGDGSKGPNPIPSSRATAQQAHDDSSICFAS